MQILKDRKKQDVSNVFNNSNELLDYIKKENDKINTDSKMIVNSINKMYNRMLNEDGFIKFSRFNRWYPKELGFKKKNILQLDFWLERGWSDIDGKNKISEITSERANKGIKTKSKLKGDITINRIERFKYKTVEFESSEYPKCGICDSKLKLSKVNIRNKNDKFYYKIKECSNYDCKSHKMSKTEKYKIYLPQEIANSKIEELNEIINKSNLLCVGYWLNKGLTVDEAKNEISKIQSYNSNQVKNRFIPSKENLKDNGFSEEEIRLITLTPALIEFWLNKGYSKDEAKIKVSKNQLNASKHVNYMNRLLPSNIDYWVGKGFNYQQAKDKVSKHQTTFSKEICIKKYGKEEGLKRFTERQNKWLSNYNRNNFSKISQELFWLIINSNNFDNDEVYFATYKNGELDDSGVNNEYRLKLNESFILPDFFIKNSGKIIEFDGVYYHRPTPENLLRETKRDNNIINSGYEVLHISENDYIKNKQKIIDKCLEFLGKK